MALDMEVKTGDRVLLNWGAYRKWYEKNVARSLLMGDWEEDDPDFDVCDVYWNSSWDTMYARIERGVYGTCLPTRFLHKLFDGDVR